MGYEFDLKHYIVSIGGLYQHKIVMDSTPKLLYSKGRICANPQALTGPLAKGHTLSPRDDERCHCVCVGQGWVVCMAVTSDQPKLSNPEDPAASVLDTEDIVRQELNCS